MTLTIYPFFTIHFQITGLDANVKWMNLFKFLFSLLSQQIFLYIFSSKMIFKTIFLNGFFKIFEKKTIF